MWHVIQSVNSPLDSIFLVILVPDVQQSDIIQMNRKHSSLVLPTTKLNAIRIIFIKVRVT